MYTMTNDVLGGLLDQFAQTEQFMFFDTSKPCAENQFSYLFHSPVERLQCHGDSDPKRFLDEIQGWLDRGYYVAGWFDYEFGTLLLEGVGGLTSDPRSIETVVADVGIFPAPYRFDHRTGKSEFRFLNRPEGEDRYSVSSITPNVNKQEYVEALEKVLAYIRAGDTYQVNYTLKLLFEFSGSAENFYRDLRRNQSVSYGAYLRWDDQRIMSFSPELFFRKKTDRLVVRPMKGTLKRGRNGIEDANASLFLHHDQKNRSENVMIVDLLRNDLGRVIHEAGGGEVNVQTLFDVETYESLLQMTSTIHGVSHSTELNSLTLHDLFTALFPCGSITGAPKIRTMEIIGELEKDRRGVYTGAIGFLTPENEAVFNVPIRTVVIRGEKGEMGIGSGITHDSDPHDEWRECLLKGRFLTNPVQEFSLIETLLYVQGDGFWLLDEHLSRLKSSALYYCFQYDEEVIVTQLKNHIEEINPDTPLRVRLLLGKDGSITVTSVACELPAKTDLPEEITEPDKSTPVVRFSQETVDTTVSWCMHKTTMRSLYDREFSSATQEGCFDVLFTNERGEVTEGAITNLIINKDGKYLTPPVESGLLAGTMRASLLGRKRPVVVEQVLSKDDVVNAEAVFLCNSVRGVVQVIVE